MAGCPHGAELFAAHPCQRHRARFFCGTAKPPVAAQRGRIPDSVRLNLGYLDPAKVNVEEWKDREEEGILYVPKAGEILYRIK